MIRLSLFGSIERFAILLLEHFAGELPLWLTPEQVRILPISQEHAAYAEEIMRVLRTADFRTEIDGSPDQLGCKIRKAASEKVPYLIVVGKDEEKDHLVTVRFREEVHKRIALKDFLLHLQEEVSNIPRKCQSGDRKPT